MIEVVLVGASVPNLYLARGLKKYEIYVTIYEKNQDYNNSQNRALPTSFLRSIGYPNINEDEEITYLVLTDLKKFLSRNVYILYNSNLKINFFQEKIYLEDEEIKFGNLVLNTAHKKLILKSDKILTYDYSVLETEKNIVANSLISSIKKVEIIKNRIVENNLRQEYDSINDYFIDCGGVGEQPLPSLSFDDFKKNYYTKLFEYKNIDLKKE